MSTSWYQTTENGEQIIWDDKDYKKFCKRLKKNSVMLSLEGWVCVEKVVRYQRSKSLICP